MIKSVTTAADGCEGQRGDDDEGVFPGAELDVEQHEDDGQADGDDEREALLFLAEAVELAGPGVVVAGGEFDLVRSACCCRS